MTVVSPNNYIFSPESDSDKEEDFNDCCASPSNRSLGLEYDSDSSCVAKRSKMCLILADFLNGKLESLTRKDLASYLLPQVAFIPPEDVQIADSAAKAFNPLFVNQRPSESTVQHSMDLLKGDTANLVRIGILGSFTLQSVKAFDKMSLLASETSKVREELQWLSRLLSPQTHV